MNQNYEHTGLPLKYWAPTYGELNLYLRSPYGQNSKYTYVLPTASSIYTYVLPTPHQNKLKSPINPFIRRDIPTTYLLSCNLRRVKSTYRRGKYLRVATLFEPRAGISYEQKYSALYLHGFDRQWRYVRCCGKKPWLTADGYCPCKLLTCMQMQATGLTPEADRG